MLSPQDIEREMHVHRTLAERDEIILNLAKENEGLKNQIEKVTDVVKQMEERDKVLLEQIESLTKQIAELKIPNHEVI